MTMTEDANKSAQKRPRPEEMELDEEVSVKKPSFPPISREKLKSDKTELRKVPIPPHRYTPLKESWMKLYTPIVEQLKLQVRFNVKTRTVELKTSAETADVGSIQKAADFIKAFTLGFDIDDCLALVRLDDLFLETFEILCA